MKTPVVTLALALLAAPVLAQASCDAVKSSIDAKLKAKGVANYTLTVVDAGKSAGGGKVVGQCEGSKQIVYARGAAGSAPAAGAADKADGADGADKGKPAGGKSGG
jgi:hypothetical protein